MLRLLRPYRGMIALGLLLLIVSTPCELFPALVWLYVTDDLIGTGHGRPTPVLSLLISFVVLGQGQESAKEENAPTKEVTDSIGMKLVYIKPGKFMMGSPRDEKRRRTQT